MIGSGEHPMFAFGWPHDPVTVCALLVACLCLVPFPWKPAASKRLWWSVLAVLALCAALLSYGYYGYYLHGQPRLIDATTYLLEARSIADGSFGWTVQGPSSSYRGRFVVSTVDNLQTVAGIFPPGYPLLLSLGVRLGHFEWIGPLLATALVLLTYALAVQLFRHRPTAVLAAALSCVSACLRYHTADTMSHGWSSVLTILALLSAGSFSRPDLGSAQLARRGLLLGVVLGWLICTRQLTGLAVSAAVGLPWFVSERRRQLILALPMAALGLLPGLAVLLAQHDFITGHFWESPQNYYYARADGPPGCFRLGWGAGCLFEHGNAVSEQGGGGLGLVWMLRNTLHRLHWHLMDIANFEPLVMVAIWTAFKTRRSHIHGPARALLILLPLGYGLFYFNGSYPGGGARFFSELIPIWHVFLAAGLMRLRAAKWGLFCSLLGFSLHASFAHETLSSPHFGPSTTHFERALSELEQRLEVDDQSSLVFFSTAHHFNLAAQRTGRIVAARRTHDSRETFVMEAVAADLVFNFDAATGLSTWSPPTDDPRLLNLEAEFDYPILDVQGAWVHPEHLGLPCVSQGRALAVHRIRPSPALALEIPTASSGRGWAIVVDVRNRAMPCRRVDLGLSPESGVWRLRYEQLAPMTHLDRLELSRP